MAITSKTPVRLIISVALGLCVGLFFGHTSIFAIFQLVALTSLIFLSFLIVLVSDLLTKKKIDEKYILGLLSLSLIVSVLASVLTMKNIATNNQQLAEDLIPKIENYKKAYSQYPKCLSELRTDRSVDLNAFTYLTDSVQQSFRISYLVDGWHYSAYDSNDKKWTSGD